MGDAGSNLLGLLMGCIAVEGDLKTSAVVTLGLPLILLAVPFLDTTFVVLKRLKYRRPVYPGRPGAPSSPHGADRLQRPAHRALLLRLDADARRLRGRARFIHYSDQHGHLHAGGTILVVALGLIVSPRASI